MNIHELIRKYDVPVPRYTSYPTVPYWEKAPTKEEWLESVRHTAKSPGGWSLYLHIPYCETLCTFCGCNNTITKDHSKGSPYVDSILKELSVYTKAVPEILQKPLAHIHLGGGTPTFLSAAELKSLLAPILKQFPIADHGFHASIEVDPRRTNHEQLVTLRDLGFRRISMGVQDFDAEVQRLMNRIQPFEVTQKLTTDARALGFDSVNFDLIYGLAKQTRASMKESVERTIALRPDRIALYSLAIVPWIKPAQRLFKDEDLPVPEEKRELYELARAELINAGYVEIGMDHFALPTDALAIALREGTLHRNFMGYTETRTDLLLGLGVSAISETPDSFHQNEKVLPLYEQKINAGEVPTHRGHRLTDRDRQLREQILKFMTRGEVQFTDAAQATQAKEILQPMIEDGLVKIENHQLKLTDAGRPFLRNACVCFDERLRAAKPETRIFSKSI